MAEQKSRKWRFTWWMHLLIYTIFQAVFMVFDGSKFWIIFNLNDIGEEIVSNLHWLFGKFDLYHSEQLNYVTVVWGVALILHGIQNTFSKLTRKYNKAV